MNSFYKYKKYKEKYLNLLQQGKLLQQGGFNLSDKDTTERFLYKLETYIMKNKEYFDHILTKPKPINPNFNMLNTITMFNQAEPNNFIIDMIKESIKDEPYTQIFREKTGALIPTQYFLEIELTEPAKINIILVNNDIIRKLKSKPLPPHVVPPKIIDMLESQPDEFFTRMNQLNFYPESDNTFKILFEGINRNKTSRIYIGNNIYMLENGKYIVPLLSKMYPYHINFASLIFLNYYVELELFTLVYKNVKCNILSQQNNNNLMMLSWQGDANTIRCFKDNIMTDDIGKKINDFPNALDTIFNEFMELFITNLTKYLPITPENRDDIYECIVPKEYREHLSKYDFIYCDWKNRVFGSLLEKRGHLMCVEILMN